MTRVLALLLVACAGVIPSAAAHAQGSDSVAAVGVAQAGRGSVTPREAFDARIAVTKSFIMSDPGRALEEAEGAIALAAKLPSRERGEAVATGEWLKGEALTRLNRVDEAEPVVQAALDRVADKAPGTKLHGDLLKSTAAIATNTGRVEQALDLLHRAFDIYKDIDDRRSQAIVLHLIGSIYYEARDYERVLRYYEESRETYPEDLALVLSSHNNRGNALSDLGRHQEAEQEFGLALAAAREMESPLLEARILTNVASSQYRQGQNGKAEQTALRGLRIARGDEADAAEWAPFLWGVRAQAAMGSGKLADARRFIERTFDGVDLAQSPMPFRDYHESAAQLYAALGEHDRAYAHLLAFKRLDDNGREVAASTNSALLSARFDDANRELRISRLEADEIQREMELTRSQTMLTYLGIVLVMAALLIGAMFLIIRNVRQKRREIAEANRKLHHTARHDGLTGLPNRAHFRTIANEALEGARNGSREAAILIIDLDRFKTVNDTLGHNVGDKLLCHVARRLEHVSQDYATPVRLGGDEFAAIVPDIEDEERLANYATAIIAALCRKFRIDDATVNIGATVGAATTPPDAADVEALTRCADLALYAGKKDGRGRYVRYVPEMQEEADERHSLERDLRAAIDNGDLTLAYQSIVAADTQEVRAYEALLRWNHPTKGFISPDVFIPIAEEAQLIDTIGSMVLRTACTEAMNWDEHTRLAINVSATQVKNGRLAGEIIGALAASGLPANRLELEITEGVFTDPDGKTDEILGNLRSLGINLVLDDFGAGASSLALLQRADFSGIKIDRSFVRAATDGCENSVAIIGAIVALGGELAMQTTAEGIETTRELALMQELGCTQLQGYLFSRPEENVGEQCGDDSGDRSPAERAA